MPTRINATRYSSRKRGQTGTSLFSRIISRVSSLTRTRSNSHPLSTSSHDMEKHGGVNDVGGLYHHYFYDIPPSYRHAGDSSASMMRPNIHQKMPPVKDDMDGEMSLPALALPPPVAVSNDDQHRTYVGQCAGNDRSYGRSGMRRRETGVIMTTQQQQQKQQQSSPDQSLW